MTEYLPEEEDFEDALDPGITPLPVIIKGSDIIQELAPNFAGCQTYAIPAQGNPVIQPIPILSRRLRRMEARLFCYAAATTQVCLNTSMAPLSGINPSGFIIPVPASPSIFEVKWRARQPCYAIGIGSALSIAVIDDTFTEPET